MTLEFWTGEFGDEYTERNTGNINARINLWEEIIQGLDFDSVLEVGANTGQNLRALRTLTDAEFFALEPNVKARKHLISSGLVLSENMCRGTAINIDTPFIGGLDLVFTSGVLIHIPPSELLLACKEIYRISKKYIVCIEYFSAQMEEIEYRGHRNVLWKRDFGKFWLDNFDLKVVNYGFAWKPVTGLDNLTWWVFEKCN